MDQPTDVKVSKETIEVKSGDPLIDKSVKNSRNVPSMVFIERIDDYIEKYGGESLIEDLSQYLNKFKYMEAQITKHSEGVKAKIPDIEKAIEVVEYIEKRKTESTEPMNIDFMVNNNLWAKAEVPSPETVCLWLGADIMCEFTPDEAKALLSNNLSKAQATLKNNETDLDFVKDQITVCEVNIARIYNENLKKRQTKI